MSNKDLKKLIEAIIFTSNKPAAPMQEIIIQATFQGFLSGFLALILYTRAVAILGAARGAVFATLVPGVAILLAIPVLDEMPNLLEISGVLAVTAGMVYSLSLGKKNV